MARIPISAVPHRRLLQMACRISRWLTAPAPTPLLVLDLRERLHQVRGHLTILSSTTSFVPATPPTSPTLESLFFRRAALYDELRSGTADEVLPLYTAETHLRHAHDVIMRLRRQLNELAALTPDEAHTLFKTPPPKQPSILAIYNALLELQTALPLTELEFFKSSFSLFLTTPPITLTDDNGNSHYLGPFEISLLATRGATSFDCRAMALDPQPSHKGHEHPHIDDGYICMGDASSAFYEAVESFAFPEAFALIESVLTNYNSSSPYCALEEWDEPRSCCQNCDYETDDLSITEDTGMAVCDECGTCCDDCGYFFSNPHITTIRTDTSRGRRTVCLSCLDDWILSPYDNLYRTPDDHEDHMSEHEDENTEDDELDLPPTRPVSEAPPAPTTYPVTPTIGYNPNVINLNPSSSPVPNPVALPRDLPF